MQVEQSGAILIVTSELLRVTFDSQQGGNITQAAFRPLDVVLLTTNYHSTDVYVRIEGIGGFYTTGDSNAIVRVVAADSHRIAVEAESLLAPRPENPPGPPNAGRVLRRYTMWDDLPVIRFDTSIEIDPALGDWRSEDARLVDMETNHAELNQFAYPGPDGRTVSAKLDKARNGEISELAQPWYALFGERAGLTIRLDDQRKYCHYWTENLCLNIPRLKLHGVAWLAQWGFKGHAVRPADGPLKGTFWVCLHDGPGPKEFACR